MEVGPRATGAAALARLVLIALLTWPALTVAAAAQGVPPEGGTPEATAEAYLRSVRAIRWGEVRGLLHPDALGRFHELVHAMVELDATGETRVLLTGEDSSGFAGLDAGEVFERAVGTLSDSLPGLMHALFDHDDRVFGHVVEGPDTAHVVYRTTPRISGAVSEVEVVQMLRTGDGWRVLWSEELGALDAALRGVRLGRPPTR